MGKLLIVKTGTTHASIFNNFGDFDDFIINQLGISRDKVIVAPVFERKILPAHEDFSSVIITGSHSMVSNLEDWSVYTSNWLKEVANHNIPVLGICYGHQLLAQTFGGEVAYHPRGLEAGSVEISLTQAGQSDRLLGVLPASFSSFVAHAQTVTRLPAQASVLAMNDFESCHAVSFGKNIWGVQFHPEFNAGITRIYINELKDKLEKDGYDLGQLYSSVQDNPYGSILLKKFVEFASPLDF